MLRELTNRQRQIFDFWREYIDRNGTPPTLIECAAAFGFKSVNAAAEHAQALVNKGWLCRPPSQKARSLTVSSLARAALSCEDA